MAHKRAEADQELLGLRLGHLGGSPGPTPTRPSAASRGNISIPTYVHTHIYRYMYVICICIYLSVCACIHIHVFAAAGIEDSRAIRADIGLHIGGCVMGPTRARSRFALSVVLAQPLLGIFII